MKEAIKMLAKLNLGAETPAHQFCSMVAKQKKRVRLAHLRQKGAKTREEEKTQPYEEFYEDLYTKNAIMEEVRTFIRISTSTV